ncbi:MAG: phosphoribosyltransferase [Chitinophagaceae bacterium]|nr:phosphoribosyltransferase [Chitinophagaceae bacterium]
MSNRVEIMNAKQAEMKIERLAFEIYENNMNEKELILVGLAKRGFEIAILIQQKIDQLFDIKTKLIALKIDKKNPIDCSLDADMNLDKKSIILIDDVANSGRTLLYALMPFLNVIANKIQIAVLVDRKHKSYPISPDFVGLQISTTLQEHIQVDIEKGKISGAFIE